MDYLVQIATHTEKLPRHVKTGCILAGKPVEVVPMPKNLQKHCALQRQVFAHPELAKAKASAEKACNFQRRERKFILRHGMASMHGQHCSLLSLEEDSGGHVRLDKLQ